MKRFIPFFSVIFLLTLCFTTAFAVAPNMPKLGEISGNTIYSKNISPVITGRITYASGSATSFVDNKFSYFRSDDYFNQSWKIYVLPGATNITAATIVDVTDFVNATGTFTTTDAGANWATGDEFLILFGTMGTDLEGVGQLSYGGTVTTASASVPASTDWIGLPDDLFNEKYYCEVTVDATPLTAPQSELRRITDFVGSTGTITVSPVFSSTTVLGDRLTIMHESVCKDRLPGNLMYFGTVSVVDPLGTGVGSIGTLEDPTDSCFVAELKGFGDDYFNEAGYWLKVVNTTDGAAPLGEKIKIIDYRSVDGLFTFGAADGYSLSANLTALDNVTIIDESIANSDRNILQGEPFIQSGSASTTAIYTKEVIGLGNTPFGAMWLKGGRYYAKCIWTHDGAAPEGEMRAITAVNTGTGLLTCDAFSQVVATNDILAIVPESSYMIGMMADAAAAGDVTATDNLTAYIKQLLNEQSGTVGVATDLTGVFHASGVSMLENLNWQSDSLRKVAVNTDSTLFYIHSTTGMPAATGAFPAAGISLNEKVQFLADSLRKIHVLVDSTYFYQFTTTGSPAVTGAFPAAGVSESEGQQFIADSLRALKVAFDSLYSEIKSTAGLAVMPTGLFPANGVNLFEISAFLADSLRKVGVNTDSTLFYIHSTTGMPAATGAFPAAGISLNEKVQFLADSLRKAFVEISTMTGVLGIPEADTIIVSTVDGSATAWTAAAHRIATVTSVCLVRAFAVCTETITSGGTPDISLGIAGDTDVLIPLTTDITAMAANDVWAGNALLQAADFATDWTLVSGTDIDLLVVDDATTDGAMDIYIIYIPVTATGAVAYAAWD